MKWAKIDELMAQIAAMKTSENTILYTEKWANKMRLMELYAANYLAQGSLSKEDIADFIKEESDFSTNMFRKYDKKEVYELMLQDKIWLKLLDGKYKEMPISIEFIRDLHENMFFEPFDKEKRNQLGKWKTFDNQLINYRNETIYFAPAEKVADEMILLVSEWKQYLIQYNAKQTNTHPIERIAQFHLDFLQIHPFADGNGRIARMLMNIMLDSFGYPNLLIGENEKPEYERTLALAQAYKKMPQSFYDFVAERVWQSLQLKMRYLSGNYTQNRQAEMQIRLQELKQKLALENDKIENRKEKVNWQVEILPFLHQMFLSFEENTAPFSDLFFETKRKMTFFCMDAREDWVQQIFHSSADFGHLKEVLMLNDCTFSYSATHFRYHANAPFSLSMDVLKVVFQEYEYQILCRKGDGMFVFRTYPYHKSPNAQEISDFFVEIAAEILAKITESSD